MKPAIALIIASAIFAGCKGQPKQDITGRWQPVEIRPDKGTTADSSTGFSFAIANMALAQGPKSMVFRQDSLWGDGKLIALYRTEDSTINFRFTGDKDSATCRFNRIQDSLWVHGLPGPGCVTVLTKI